MEVLATTESVIQENNASHAGAEPREPSQREPKTHENKFQRAISAWRNIDLSNLIPKLDSTASDIVAHQRDSLVQRKDLAQKTKDFRKLDDATKLAEYRGLLKSYQAFIDLLTSHGKTSSSAFLQLYSALSEAPDPYPLLEASVDSLVASEDTVPKLTKEKTFLQRSVDRLTSQLEETEKKLSEERTLRQQLEENQESKIKEIESTWTAALAESTSNWEAKERNYEEKLENHERLLKEIKASYEASQRLDRSEDGDVQRSAAMAAELEIVTADLEKTSHRLAEVEARNEQLRLDLAQAVSHSQAESKYRSVEDDPAYLRLQFENASLLRKLDSIRYDKETEKAEWESKLRHSERLSAKISAERDELRAKLEKQADYEDIRRELEVIKSIEFSTGDDEDGDAVESSTVNDGQATKAGSLEQLLMSRNKKLSDELTILRVSHQDLQQQLQSLREELLKSNAELEKSRNLASNLENDLLLMQKETMSSSAMSVAGTYTSRHPHSSRRGRASPTSSIISGFDNSGGTVNTMEAIRAGEAVSGGSGILPMVQAQRDRFKQKNAELEEELSKSYATIKSLRQEVASLQKDNLNLYEKTRYISTYNRGSSSSATPYGNKPGSTSIQIDTDTSSGGSLSRYQSAYEAKISPFAAFRGRESTRAYRRMSLPERLIFSITRMVLANRTSRNLFAAYCLALHILLLAMLYTMTTAGIEQHTVTIGTAAAGGAAIPYDVAGGDTGGKDPGDWQQEALDQAL
ncbi:hypothetical protein VTO42DRAFT_9059 [Malbranchea cinnamomea]